MARKRDVEIQRAAQSLAPTKPAAPLEPWADRKASYEGARARFQQAALSHPKPRPIEHWKRVLANPYACGVARQMAQEAIEELERRAPTEERIRIEAEIQETARRIAKQLGEKQDERTGDPAPA